MQKIKRKNYFVGLAVKNIHFFIGFIVLAYLLSQIVVQGSTMISGAIDTITAGKEVEIAPLVLTTLMLIGASMVLAFCKTLCGELFSIRIQKECKNITVQTLSHLEYSYFTDSAGAVITKLTSDIGEIGTLFSENLPCIVQYVVTIVTMCVSVFFINRSLLFGLLITYPIVLLITDFIARRLVALTKARKGNYDALAEVANDGLQGVVVGRSYQLYTALNERINQVGKTILKNEYMRNRWGAVSTIAENLIKWMPMVICSLIALTQVFEGKLTVGGLTAFVILFNKISSQMGELPFIINESRELLVSVQRLNGILNEPQEPSGTYCGGEAQQKNAAEHGSAAQQENETPSCKAVMELCDAGFWYEEAPECKIFEHLNLAIQQGKTTAIVGPSGAGKSTIFKLLCGFARPKEGVLKLYGTDFNEWNLAAARERISLVSQNVFLFPDTIRANVEFGRPHAAFEEVVAACKAAKIHDYIMSLPDQY